MLRLIRSFDNPIRLYSSFSNGRFTSLNQAVNYLKNNSDKVDTQWYHKLLTNDELVKSYRIDNETVPDQVYEEVTESSHELLNMIRQNPQLTKDDKSKLLNNLLTNFVHIDYSLTHKVLKELEKLEKTPHVLTVGQIIKHNSGRVKTSFEIYRDFMKIEEFANQLKSCKEDSDFLHSQILEKVVYGDKSEADDGYKLDEERMKRALSLLPLLNEKQIVNEIQKQLLISSIELGTLSDLLEKTVISREILESQLFSTENDEISDENRALLWVQYFQQLSSNNEPVPLENIAKILPVLAKAKGHQSEFDSLVQYIGANNLDSRSTWDGIIIRAKLINSIGIGNKDLVRALEFHTKYQDLQGQSLEFINSAAILVLGYHSVLKENDKLLPLMHALTPPESIPIKVLQCFILTYGGLGRTGDALDLYNRYIGDVSKENNPKSHISQTLLLTESVVMAHLYNHDREFAYLLNDGVITNKVIEGDTSINRLKLLFKKYGQAISDEKDTEASKEQLKVQLLDAVESL
ncbi:BA75_03880T0 [Komagataella pastoris]|uniref:BA75_03880T0 n=1 Tax=Komagataella pastoris TaxID=4922 RepID=A0A1B2JER5_PICPA|nr:BA75_03880T0 [Komagataella pastoris]